MNTFEILIVCFLGVTAVAEICGVVLNHRNVSIAEKTADFRTEVNFLNQKLSESQQQLKCVMLERDNLLRECSKLRAIVKHKRGRE